MIRTRLVVVVLVLGAAQTAQAQHYCASDSDGTRKCGLPTLESCEQSVRGVGGSCDVDDSAQIPPNLMQRLFRPPPDSSPPAFDPDYVPPPPPN